MKSNQNKAEIERGIGIKRKHPPSKCIYKMLYNLPLYKKILLRHLHGHTLERDHHHSRLGIILSQGLKWPNYVAQTSSSAKQTLGV